MEQPLPTTLLAPGPAGWSQAPSPAAGAFRVGVLISRTFSVWGRNVLRFAPLGMLSRLPIAVGTYLFYSRSPELLRGPQLSPVAGGAFLEELAGFYARIILAFLPYSLATGLLSLLALGAVVHGAARRLAGEPARLGGMLVAGLRALPAIFVASLVAWLAGIPATLALVFPAVILAVGWSAAVPAIVVERAGPVAALRRSWGLTRGYRWHIFAGVVVVYLAMMAGAMVVQTPLMAMVVTKAVRAGLSGAPSTPDFAGLALVTAVVQVLQGGLQTMLLVLPAVVHHGLRLAKEGDDPARLARVFE